MGDESSGPTFQPLPTNENSLAVPFTTIFLAEAKSPLLEHISVSDSESPLPPSSEPLGPDDQTETISDLESENSESSTEHSQLKGEIPKQSVVINTEPSEIPAQSELSELKSIICEPSEIPKQTEVKSVVIDSNPSEIPAQSELSELKSAWRDPCETPTQSEVSQLKSVVIDPSEIPKQSEVKSVVND
jgi:hypothetical protein